MLIATYNVEWFTDLFDEDNKLFNDAAWSGRNNVTRARQTRALGTVFRALDADAVMIIEAPDESRKHETVKALEAFAAHFDLRTSAAIMGFANETQQEIALLYDPDKLTVSHAPGGMATGPKGPLARQDLMAFCGLIWISMPTKIWLFSQNRRLS